LHPDWLGTKRLATAVAGGAQDFDTAFDPYGRSYDTFGSLQVRDFAGTLEFTVYNLFDTPNRELSMNSGRWLSPDSAHASWNAYAYPTNPNNLIDPSGLYGEPLGPVGSLPVQRIFGGQDCLGCWSLGPSPIDILQQVLSGNLAGALQSAGVVPTNGVDYTSGICVVNPIMDAEPQLENSGKKISFTMSDAEVKGWQDLWNSLTKPTCGALTKWAKQDLVASGADNAVARSAAKMAATGRAWMAPVAEVFADTSVVEFFSAAFEEGSSYLICH
jgi:RHS repeat-associated protein